MLSSQHQMLEAQLTRNQALENEMKGLKANLASLNEQYPRIGALLQELHAHPDRSIASVKPPQTLQKPRTQAPSFRGNNSINHQHIQNPPWELVSANTSRENTESLSRSRLSLSRMSSIKTQQSSLHKPQFALLPPAPRETMILAPQPLKRPFSAMTAPSNASTALDDRSYPVPIDFSSRESGSRLLGRPTAPRVLETPIAGSTYYATGHQHHSSTSGHSLEKSLFRAPSVIPATPNFERSTPARKRFRVC
jgi:hypothetical protein